MTLLRIQNSACMSVKSSASDADWLPKDLQPSPQTKAILAKAAKGDVVSQVAAAGLYESGEDLPPNEERAVYWRERAAAGGDASMQHDLFEAAFYGRGMQRNRRLALEWLEKSAKQGYVPAQRDLGVIYLMGEDDANVKPTASTAVEWLTQSANAGDGESAYQLGEAYSSGTYFPVDLDQAAAWYRKGAENKDGRSMVKLAKLIRDTDHKEAMALFRRANSINQSEATTGLASYFPWGKTPTSDAEIVTTQKQHAEQGDVSSQIAMAIRYGTGEGIDKDSVEALKWWRKAAETGDAVAQRYVGRYLISGNATPENPEEAKAWLQKAADQGDAAAQEDLAYFFYLPGYRSTDKQEVDQIKTSNATALDLMRKAAAQGSTSARERAALWARVLSNERDH